MWGKKKKETQETAGFADELAGVERGRLTPANVQEKVFRLSFRGYNEQDVDQFLDEVTEELAATHEENKRLREKVDDGGGMVSSDVVREGERRAAETVRQAREYAARLMEDAGKRAAAEGVAPMGVAPPASFLIQERDFLQRLASLVQEHAEALKAQARGSRAAAPSRPESPTSTPLVEPLAPQPPVIPREERGEPSQATEAHEPFIDDWEGTFSSGSEDQPYAGGESDLFREQETPEGGEREKKREEEPSLRELFWGEE